MEHTKLPWENDDASYLIKTASGFETIALVNYLGTITKANARFIVTACNSHEALVSALKDCLSLLDKQREEYNNSFSILPHEKAIEGPIARKARKALSHAEAKQ